LNLLVDTHVFLWLINRSPEISQRQIDMVNDEGNSIHLSVVSIFEIATKWRIGKLALPPQFQNGLTGIYRDYGYVPMPLLVPHADLAGRLPGAHKDPFDRLLAAQAIVEDMAIMTIDRRIADLGARVVW
jgi:PIN domain nuclease of toxin-antitoxin system